MGMLADAFRDDCARSFARAVEAVRQDLAQRSPVDTGYMRSTITSRVLNRFEAEVSTNTGEDYPEILDAGSGPHKIRVRTARVLTNGVDFFGTEVDHPGSTKHVGWWSGPESERVFCRVMEAG